MNKSEAQGPRPESHRLESREKLDDSEISELRKLTAELRNRLQPAADATPQPAGNLVLFTGPSGTGKTMAAEVMAHELGVNLLRIDLSRLVSNYIGETEKNLSAVFDQAATSNAILFFDEADALFGKRSEVKDSHDRYANSQSNYLFQRAREYRGIVILACSRRGAIGEAGNVPEFKISHQ